MTKRTLPMTFTHSLSAISITFQVYTGFIYTYINVYKYVYVFFFLGGKNGQTCDLVEHLTGFRWTIFIYTI